MGTKDVPQSLLLPPADDLDSESIRGSQAGVVPWSPPQSNWNPWTSCNIDEGPMAYVRSYCSVF